MKNLNSIKKVAALMKFFFSIKVVSKISFVKNLSNIFYKISYSFNTAAHKTCAI